MSEIYQPRVTHFSTSQTVIVWSLESPVRCWEIELSFYYIPKSQITPPEVTHIYVIQAATILSRELIKGLWKKLRQSEKITKISEQPLQKWEIGLSFYILYKVSKHLTQSETPQYQLNN